MFGRWILSEKRSKKSWISKIISFTRMVHEYEKTNLSQNYTNLNTIWACKIGKCKQ